MFSLYYYMNLKKIVKNWGIQKLRKQPDAVAQVFSCEFWEIFRNAFFTEHLWTTTSETTTKFSRLNSIFSVEDDYSFTLVIYLFQLSGLRQFLATESPLKFTKNVFYFTLKRSFRFQDI